MSTPVRVRPALLVLPMLALTACGGSSSSGPTPVAAAGPADAQTAEVDGLDTLKFAPAAISAKVGTLKLTDRTKGGVSHNLVFADGTLPMTGTVEAGQSEVLTLHLDKPGTYAFQCTFHTGMVGKVVVS